ncbi:MAG: flagellar hook-basal body complex protein FliE [Methylobacteriaceae bacterium]|nr:flagellar hook-basal body complex protein FliE [Methylobacteriaceae bacterium]
MATTSFAAGAYAATGNLPAGRGRGGFDLAGPDEATQSDFGSLLKGALEGVAASAGKADAQAMAVASGRTDLVDVVTAVAESETALQTLVAVRDRVISAYEEIMRMQI